MPAPSDEAAESEAVAFSSTVVASASLLASTRSSTRSLFKTSASSEFLRIDIEVFNFSNFSMMLKFDGTHSSHGFNDFFRMGCRLLSSAFTRFLKTVPFSRDKPE